MAVALPKDRMVGGERCALQRASLSVLRRVGTRVRSREGGGHYVRGSITRRVDADADRTALLACLPTCPRPPSPVGVPAVADTSPLQVRRAVQARSTAARCAFNGFQISHPRCLAVFCLL